jgi:hypothetical protein
MAILRKFPSIEQFKNVITNVRQFCKKHDKPLPTLTFEGTVKLHGTNGGIGYDFKTGELWAQSRERIITPYDDNAAFAKYVEANKDAIKAYMHNYAENGGLVYLFGEWCGPSIQKSVAISEIENKSFFPFELIEVVGEGDDATVIKYDLMADDSILEIPDTYRVASFRRYSIDIDFNAPQESQNKLVELTMKVEEQCPVAADFGKFGIGEGIVWYNAETGLRFKVKGEKHSVSKVSTVKEISAEDLARISTIKTFVDTVVTENRLNQGLDKLREMGLEISVKSTGDYIKWVVGDVLKEEMDLIIASCLDKKELNPAMSNKAKEFFFAHLKTLEAVAA